MNNAAEIPPKETSLEELKEQAPEDLVEQLKAASIPEHIDNSVEDQRPTAEDDAAIEQQRSDISSAIFKLQNKPVEQQTFEPITEVVEPKAPVRKMPWFRRAAVALGLTGMVASGAHASTEDPKNGSKEEKKGKTVSVAPEKKPLQGISFYAGGTEKTPTGKDNAFSNNMDKLSEADLLVMAEKLELPTTSNEDLQKALLEKYPDEVTKVMKEYGITNAGTFVDGILGARVKEVLKNISEKKDQVPETPVTPPLEQPTPKKVEAVPMAKYVINVRGDEKNGDGAYYFFDTEQELRDALASTGAPTKSLEFRKDYGHATIDMNASVFNKYYAKSDEAKHKLGTAMTRNPSDVKTFIAKTSPTTPDLLVQK